MKMISGYCFELEQLGDSEKATTEPYGEWLLAIYTPDGQEEFSFFCEIDGAHCAVFVCPDGVFRAQTAASVGA